MGKNPEPLCAYFKMSSCDHDLGLIWFLIDEYSRKHVNLGNCKESGALLAFKAKLKKSTKTDEIMIISKIDSKNCRNK